MARRPGTPSRAASEARAIPANLIALGEFGRAQGLRGEIRLKSYTSDPLAIAGYGPLLAADGRTFVLTDAKPAPGSSPDLLVVRVAGVTDRTGAEALTRVALYCSRDKLGKPEDEDEFFAADLVGLDAVDATGTVIGIVIGVPNYGGGDLLEIRPALGGATALLPFTKAFVPTLDVQNRRIVIDPPEDLFAPPGPKPADEPD
ncbi:ribosome maturation factor RimM [Methylobacterium haplocladii]|uniref:Ribosome maturation factor RimM n=1 Tax=Methylobacterium haplocladii TaxID=1176176 RepID=A0A512IUH6_9HYPH|nr:ribosome maturation factor RimM [Methylobacterium haplocladii]GEP01352.1 ribosome maturation factor RimM [Methylobacterium haplocladii]GJD83846.1 Ribosome maturation factor RimM [Methylobacterium haplocladii]GLS58243.1 ribosome maturation factor RimM [Methylobacterium haplocladii]